MEKQTQDQNNFMNQFNNSTVSNFSNQMTDLIGQSQIISSSSSESQCQSFEFQYQDKIQNSLIFYNHDFNNEQFLICQSKDKEISIQLKCPDNCIVQQFCVNLKCNDPNPFICDFKNSPSYKQCKTKHKYCMRKNIKDVLNNIENKCQLVEKCKKQIKKSKNSILQMLNKQVQQINKLIKYIQTSFKKQIKYNQLTKLQKTFYDIFIRKNIKNIDEYNGNIFCQMCSVNDENQIQSNSFRLDIKQKLKRQNLFNQPLNLRIQYSIKQYFNDYFLKQKQKNVQNTVFLQRLIKQKINNLHLNQPITQKITINKLCRCRKQKVTHICIDEKCDQNFKLVCQEFYCNEKKRHRFCQKRQLNVFIDKLKDKYNSFNKYKNEINQYFNTSINKIYDTKQKILLDFEYNLKYAQLFDVQKQLLQSLMESKEERFKGLSQLNGLQINYLIASKQTERSVQGQKLFFQYYQAIEQYTKILYASFNRSSQSIYQLYKQFKEQKRNEEFLLTSALPLCDVSYLSLQKQLQKLRGLQNLFKKKIKKFNLIYKGIQNKFSIEKYEQKCKDKKNTIILCQAAAQNKAQNISNKLFGGFSYNSFLKVVVKDQEKNFKKKLIGDASLTARLVMPIATFGIQAYQQIIKNLNQQQDNDKSPFGFNLTQNIKLKFQQEQCIHVINQQIIFGKKNNLLKIYTKNNKSECQTILLDKELKKIKQKILKIKSIKNKLLSQLIGKYLNQSFNEQKSQKKPYDKYQ